MTPTEALPPDSIIGILGGGQLGRLLALAAARLGMRTHIYSPDPESPAFDVTPLRTIAAYENEATLAAFVAAVDVVTYEFENVPAETAHLLARLAPLRPGANAVLKTTRLGYDGKGQRLISDPGEAAAAFAALAPKPLVLEAFIAFDKEISVVVARGLSGEVRAFEPAENVHRHHILHTSTVPATIPRALAAAAITAASAIATALDYVGVLGVEFFVTGEALLVNEIAPRVHNSGHWTQAVCITDQFEQHIRAICGWPLGDPTRLADVVMENLIGDDVLDIASRLGPHDRLELYGKREARPDRKMGHLNHVAPWESAK